MSGIKGMVGKRMSKKVKFMSEDVEIYKLSVAEVLQIQQQIKDDAAASETDSFNTLHMVIRLGVADAAELSSEDFNAFPMDELSRLSNEVMKFSGVAAEQGK